MALEERTQLATEGIVVAAVEVARPPPPRPLPEDGGTSEVRAGAGRFRSAAVRSRGGACVASRGRASPGSRARTPLVADRWRIGSGRCGVRSSCLSPQKRGAHPSDGQCGAWGWPPAAACRACERDRAHEAMTAGCKYLASKA